MSNSEELRKQQEAYQLICEAIRERNLEDLFSAGMSSITTRLTVFSKLADDLSDSAQKLLVMKDIQKIIFDKFGNESKADIKVSFNHDSGSANTYCHIKL